MGGRSSTAERNHQNYLGERDFENLDSYDEETLNDQSLTREQTSDQFPEVPVNRVDNELKMASAAIKSQDRGRVQGSINRIENLLKNPELTEEQRKSLRKQLSNLLTAANDVY